MTELDFKALAAQGYNRIPLIAESFADLDTPLSLYLKLARSQARSANSFLLESVVGGERFGRYSFIGLPARTALRAFIGDTPGQHRIEVLTDRAVGASERGAPLAFVQDYLARFKVAVRPGLPRFCGGLAGYFGYDTVRLFEKKLARPRADDLGLPDIHLVLTEELAVIDNLTGRAYLIVYADASHPEGYQRARERLRELRGRLARHIEPPHTRASVRRPEIREFAKADYLKMVERCKEYIAAGDAMQVVLGQRISKQYADAPLSLYRALRTLNPSPYMYFYDFGDHQIVGSSPEILVRSEDRVTPQGTRRIVALRPIAGTRPRGGTPEQDAVLAAELMADPKERAEHLMLIDLARNDIGRIAVTGSVRVTEQMVIERYSHVQHLVSHVEGELKPGMSNLDVLRATFPAGTLSGAPKVRAMEIIDELEPVKRGIYGGAVGYLSFAGDMDLAIAIRTGVIKDNMLYVSAAAGIVADSV
ncbi:MAG: anthranilate synthase component I family protein, partial [Betaproteobacteria bacterium]